MTFPLVILAVFTLGVAWGWPVWEVDKSYLGHLLESGEPASIVDFAEAAHEAHEHHEAAGILALAAAALGVVIAVFMYWRPKVDPAAIRGQLGGLYTFFLHKWYFDEAYDAAVVKPAVGLAFACAAADKRPTDAPPPEGEAELPPRRFDWFTLDGWLNALGQGVATVGRALRVVQTGQLRNYIVFLALTVAALLGILAVLNS
jgi:NADH-quinone oxidoreductase subunit L